MARYLTLRLPGFLTNPFLNTRQQVAQGGDAYSKQKPASLLTGGAGVG
jgi:hypothetical protein